MRTWRVGTISMGASLLFLGLFLLITQFTDVSLTHIMISWWPIILVVLGIEILLYLFMTKKEKPVLKYDFLSIFFVGIIGMVGIGFMILSSVGLLDIVDESLSREERTFDLPELTESLTSNIKRVVVNAQHYPLEIESTPSMEVSTFGTFTASVVKGEKLISEVEDYLSIHKKGDTLFLKLKNLPTESTMFNHYYPQVNTTLLIPEGVQLEVNGQGNSISAKPRAMKNNWVIANASSVDLMVEENSNLSISAEEVEQLLGKDVEWVIDTKQVSTMVNGTEIIDENRFFQNGMYKIGEGTYRINIINAHQVSLNIAP